MEVAVFSALKNLCDYGAIFEDGELNVNLAGSQVGQFSIHTHIPMLTDGSINVGLILAKFGTDLG
jgi:hypothetical protein